MPPWLTIFKGAAPTQFGWYNQNKNCFKTRLSKHMERKMNCKTYNNIYVKLIPVWNVTLVLLGDNWSTALQTIEDISPAWSSVGQLVPTGTSQSLAECLTHTTQELILKFEMNKRGGFYIWLIVIDYLIILVLRPAY